MITDRIVSFSLKPDDSTSRREVAKLQQHSKNTGKTFSFLIVQAITKFNKELENDNIRDKE